MGPGAGPDRGAYKRVQTPLTSQRPLAGPRDSRQIQNQLACVPWDDACVCTSLSCLCARLIVLASPHVTSPGDGDIDRRPGGLLAGLNSRHACRTLVAAGDSQELTLRHTEELRRDHAILDVTYKLLGGRDRAGCCRHHEIAELLRRLQKILRRVHNLLDEANLLGLCGVDRLSRHEEAARIRRPHLGDDVRRDRRRDHS
mmetsp:Transcript_33081/g.86906  ORF Transcript_33081/g.86906 Transcript_33081/m.86906 type:complete len:200 (+) Transcript_33081:186-785(+)